MLCYARHESMMMKSCVKQLIILIDQKREEGGIESGNEVEEKIGEDGRER